MQHLSFRIRAGLFSILACGVVAAHAAGQQPPERRTGRYRGDITDPATGDVIMRVAMQVPEQLPAQLVHPVKGRLWWLLDKAAAKFLGKEIRESPVS